MTNAEGSGMHKQGTEEHPLVPNQYRRGDSLVKGLREGMVWWWGEKWSILGFLPRLLLGKMPYWDGISPKGGNQRVRTT